MLLPVVALAAERGYFGFTPKVEGSGFFLNPTIEKITIYEIAPGSPATKSAMAIWDEFTEIEDKKVAGALRIVDVLPRLLYALATRRSGKQQDGRQLPQL